MPQRQANSGGARGSKKRRMEDALSIQQTLRVLTSDQGVVIQDPPLCEDYCAKFDTCEKVRNGGSVPDRGFCKGFVAVSNANKLITNQALAVVHNYHEHHQPKIPKL